MTREKYRAHILKRRNAKCKGGKDYVESNPRGLPLCVTINITLVWNTQCIKEFLSS